MRRQLNKSEIKELGLLFSKGDRVDLEGDGILFVNHAPAFFRHEGLWLPLLRYEQAHKTLKEIVVDAGAVKFVSGGADIMRPGIVQVPDSLSKGEGVRIVDAKNHVPLAIGVSLFDSKEMLPMVSGRVVLSAHHVGDKLWKIYNH